MLKLNSQKPILVTGAHRSGSTWVGKMLAASPQVGYIHEPFNLQHRPGICRAKFKHWFTCITDENEADYYDDIKKTVDFSYNLKDELKHIECSRDVLRLVRDYFEFGRSRLVKARPLIKDPIAFFSAEWLAKAFKADVVVTIRHPAAFVSGLKAKEWTFDFSNFLEQPLLMRDYLTPFADDIHEYTKNPKTIVDQGILLWNIFYSTVNRLQQSHKSWIFIRHEDLAANPISEFEKLYQRLNIRFSSKERHIVEKYTSSKNPSNAPSYTKVLGSDISLGIKRNSKASIQNWKSRLTTDEISCVRSRTLETANLFYDQQSWH